MADSELNPELNAAAAKDLLSKRFPSFSIRAYTAVYDRLLPDQERRYSGLAAEALIRLAAPMSTLKLVRSMWSRP